MNWKWWVACQVAVIAFIGEIILPYSEIFFLSIIWKLDRRVFWLYVTYDSITYTRSFVNAFPSIHLSIPSLANRQSGALSQTGFIVSTLILIGLIPGLGLIVWVLYVKPIRYIVRLRRRILHEILHVK